MIVEKRVRDGQAVIFDANTDVLKFKKKDHKLLKVLNCNGSYIAPSGKRFWQKHPYQWVTSEEATYLLGIRGVPCFVEATLDEAEEFYSY